MSRDLEWWAGVLQRYAAFPQLVPEDLVDGVLDYVSLTNPMTDVWDGFLSPVSMNILQVRYTSEGCEDCHLRDLARYIQIYRDPKTLCLLRP